MFQKNFFVSLFNAIRTVRRLSVGSLQDDISFQQYRILSLIHEGMGQTQMSQSLQVTMAAVSKTVDGLVKKGFLHREPGEDRRCYKLNLTKRGDVLRKVVRGQVENELAKSYKKLTKQEQSDLNRGLEVLDKLMGYVNEK
jgi:DNA-binding MarR family transcriptional regulator